jgi:hypothetical protein
MRKILSLLAAVCLACQSPTAPPLATPFTPPDVYHTWWVEVTECTYGRVSPFTVDFDEVEWFTVPGDDFYSPSHDTRVWGLWYGPDLYVAEGQVFNEYVVKHEMLHARGWNHPHDAVNYPWPFTGCST